MSGWTIKYETQDFGRSHTVVLVYGGVVTIHFDRGGTKLLSWLTGGATGELAFNRCSMTSLSPTIIEILYDGRPGEHFDTMWPLPRVLVPKTLLVAVATFLVENGKAGE